MSFLPSPAYASEQAIPSVRLTIIFQITIRSISSSDTSSWRLS